MAEPEVFQKAPAAPPPQEPKPAPAPKGKKAAVDVEALSAGAQRFRDWPEILQRVRGDTKSVAMAFAGSAAYVNGDYMLIEAPELAFELHQRPGKCLVCNLTYGLPQVFQRHPVLNVAGVARAVAEKLGWAASSPWKLGSTQEKSRELHCIPFVIERA